MSKKLLCFFALSTSLIISQAQEQPIKRELRGVWVATVSNIDWPSKKTLTVQQQKDELLELVDKHQAQGINALFFQVRPVADAFYESKLEPWSQWLMGKQGLAPIPAYDPLQEAIQLSHDRGMELHAWFNPYRAAFHASKKEVAPNHITEQKPEWFFVYEGKKLFNPGIPQVREYIVKVILDVVKRYDIDGVHLDDYFYPYPVKGIAIKDEKTYQEYSDGVMSIEDWRRENVNQLIKMLSDSIHHYKKSVKFGVSPFGIWKNKKDDREGSETNGQSSYLALFADTRKWAKEGWVDYLAPQIYFPFNHKLAPFEVLTDWWSRNIFQKHLYIGYGAYRIGEKTPEWTDPSQMPEQIRYARKNEQIQGGIFFSSVSLNKNFLGIADSLRNDFYKNKVLPPAMSWLDEVIPNAPSNIKAIRVPNTEKIILTWEDGESASDKEKPFGYVIYRFKEGESIDLDNPHNIIHITYNSKKKSFKDTLPQGKKCYYIMTTLDKIKNESLASEMAVLE